MARMVVVPESRIPAGSKLCVVLVSREEMGAVHGYLRRHWREGTNGTKGTNGTDGLVPLLQGVARAWIMQD